MATVKVVLGAGGPTGVQCVKKLASQDDTVVRAVVRDPAKYKDVFKESDKLEVVKGDVTDKASLKEALKDASGVIFAASGQTYWSPSEVDSKGVANVAEVAKELGVGRVVLVSSMMVSPHNKWQPIRIMLNNIRWKLMDYKFEGEELLRKSGVDYTVVRPGGLTNGPAGVGQIAAAQGDKGTASAKISRADVAAVCVEALQNPAAKNVTLEIFMAGALAGTPEDNIRGLFTGLKPDASGSTLPAGAQ